MCSANSLNHCGWVNVCTHLNRSSSSTKLIVSRFSTYSVKVERTYCSKVERSICSGSRRTICAPSVIDTNTVSVCFNGSKASTAQKLPTVANTLAPAILLNTATDFSNRRR